LHSSNLSQDFGPLNNPSIYNDIHLQGPIHDTKIRLIRKETISSDEDKVFKNNQPFQNFKAHLDPKDVQDINSSPRLIAPNLPNDNERVNSHSGSDL
jgi:hypothetical protein